MLLTCWNNFFPQSDSSQILSAIKEEISNENFYAASLLYEKLAFVSQSPVTKINARILSAECLKKIHRYDEAIDILNKIILFEQPDSVIFKVKYELALLNYLANDFTIADAHLKEMYLLIKDSTFHYRVYWLHAFILNEMYNWTEAKKKLDDYNNYINKENPQQYSLFQKKIDSLYSLTPKLKNPDKAVKLSVFLPGAGQIYCKNYSEGLLSMASIGIITATSIVLILNKYYVIPLLLGSALLSKFHSGGIIRAEFLAKKYNYIHTRQYNSTIKKQVFFLMKNQ